MDNAAAAATANDFGFLRIALSSNVASKCPGGTKAGAAREPERNPAWRSAATRKMKMAKLQRAAWRADRRGPIPNACAEAADD